MFDYYIAVKFEGDKKSYRLGTDCEPVINVIHAAFWPKRDKEKAETIATKLRDINPGTQFTVKKNRSK